MSTTTKTFKANNVLTTPDSWTLVVTRTDTAAIVTNTKATISTGIYSWTWIDPAYNLTYTLDYTLTYSGTPYTWTDTISGPAAPSAGEPTVSMTYADLYGKLVTLFGISTTTAKAYVDEAYLNFLAAYNWDFLYPVTTLTTAVGDSVTALPEDFGEMLDDFSYAANKVYLFVKEMRAGNIDELRSMSDYTGHPVYYGIEPVSTFATATGQRHQVRWYPRPDAAYVLTYSYLRIPAKLSGDTDKPIGGPMHAMTILDCAYAVYERHTGQVNGSYAQYYNTVSLPRSIAKDMREKSQAGGGNVLIQRTAPRYNTRSGVNQSPMTP